MDSRRAALIVGGYGVFGGRLARLLLERGDLRVLVAGRSIQAAQTFCAEHGGEPLALDRNDDLDILLARLEPWVVVDAAGPFQSYTTDPYRLTRGAVRRIALSRSERRRRVRRRHCGIGR